MTQENKIKRVLIVDDAPFIREILINFLEQKNEPYEIKEAENGKEAVTFFKDFKPHLIFMDIVMPILSGIEATKKIRTLNTSVPIIGLSTLTESSVIDKLLEAGASTFLQKPFNLETLNKVLKEYL